MALMSRLRSEAEDAIRSRSEGIFCKQVGDGLLSWKCVLIGMPESLYEDHALMFNFKIDAQGGYPFSPDFELEFISTLHHPVIQADGKFKFNNLHRHEWSPAMSMRTVLLSVQATFLDPSNSDILTYDCFPDHTWKDDFNQCAGKITTPLPHRRELFYLLLEAAAGWDLRSEAHPVTLDWSGGHFIKALMRFFTLAREEDLSRSIDWEHWFAFCRHLSSAYVQRKRDSSCCVSAQQDDVHLQTNRLWLVEAKLLLSCYYWGLTSVRELLSRRAWNRSLGRLSLVNHAILHDILEFCAVFPQAWATMRLNLRVAECAGPTPVA